jgi:Domain of unknown function (DUF4189)
MLRLAVALALMAMLVGAAPQARAAPGWWETWAAIAYSPSTGKDDVVSNAADKVTAVSIAIGDCNRFAGTTDCVAVVYSNYCVSLVTVPGDFSKRSGGWGTTLADADAEALEGLPNGKIQDHRCNDHQPSWGNDSWL